MTSCAASEIVGSFVFYANLIYGTYTPFSILLRLTNEQWNRYFLIFEFEIKFKYVIGSVSTMKTGI